TSILSFSPLLHSYPLCPYTTLFRSFKVQESDTARALLIGILLAIVFRIIFIAIGIELIERFHWILYVFGVFLIYTGYKLFFKKRSEEHTSELQSRDNLVCRHLPEKK